MKKQLQAAAAVHHGQGGGEDDEAQRAVMGRWRSALSSGLRAALACTIVGIFSLYAPPVLRRHITFPAFSYVVTVIIVTDATFGTALRGAVSAAQATLMGALPSVLALWLAHRTGAVESVAATSAVVALTAFAVALPESVGPVAKRIALGQVIIVYVARFHEGDRPDLSFALTHPANVVACTALGVAAAILAVVVPWPRMATRDAMDKTRAYKVLAAERVRVMADALCYSLDFDGDEASPCRHQRRWCLAACMSQATRLASASTALLHRINSVREDVRRERALLCKWAQAADADQGVETMETPLRGMQLALEMIVPQENARDNNQRNNNVVVGDLVMTIKDQVRLALLTPTKSSKLSPSSKIDGKKAQALLPMLSSGGYENQQQLAPLLFLFSLLQLHRASASGPTTISSNSSAKKQVAPAATDNGKQQQAKQDNHHRGNKRSIMPMSRRRLMTAAKCGFSLGLAVLLGLLFSNDHGFWSGLIVATTMAAGRDSTWAIALARAHGTALGSVYGALGCLLISQRTLLTMDLRFLALLPWMLLSTFLKRSRAYGPAGGVAAALSGIIIMGRRYDEPPMAFTVARLVETFIGIACVVLADLLFHPGKRPSVLARAHLARCVATLTHCFSAAVTDDDDHHHQLFRKLKQELSLLRKHVAEARTEPTYLWLPPFPESAYGNIEGSLSRIAQLLQLCLQARVALAQPTLDLDAMADDFNRVVSTSLSHCLMLATNNNNNSPSSVIDDTSQRISYGGDDDLEAGRGGSCCEEEETTAPEEVVGSFLAQAREALLVKEDGEEQEEAQGLQVCCLASMGLCMGEIIKEALRLETHILDLTMQHGY
ncbi:hypothetical protein QOZ80_9AG0671710 [Eleusine coracana subsp. coracana]|nr:hypothetical protein QOZ80_9AG0671710 [Eleusine coracana subsp. coracana]